jgi:hypothetical protein
MEDALERYFEKQEHYYRENEDREEAELYKYEDEQFEFDRRVYGAKERGVLSINEIEDRRRRSQLNRYFREEILRRI